jgi:cytochrome c nitrite reductase small subunit
MRAGFSIVTLPAVLLAAALGVAAGLGGFAFVHGKGTSYLRSDPAACANCHVMQSHFEGWQKSSHHAVATCSDCHIPATLIAGKMVKATNGFRHSLAFTTGGFPDALRARPQDHAVLEQQCRHCHAEFLLAMPHGSDDISCIRCHNSVGHLL